VGKKRISQIKQLIYISFVFVLLGHLFACLWILIGQRDRHLPEDEAKKSWLYVNDFNLMKEDTVNGFETLREVYVFSLYWLFETLTTVDYGHYACGTSREFLVSICFEFVGFCYNAVLISTMSNVFASETTFDQLLNARMNELDSWMNRL